MIPYPVPTFLTIRYFTYYHFILLTRTPLIIILPLPFLILISSLLLSITHLSYHLNSWLSIFTCLSFTLFHIIFHFSLTLYKMYNFFIFSFHHVHSSFLTLFIQNQNFALCSHLHTPLKQSSILSPSSLHTLPYFRIQFTYS